MLRLTIQRAVAPAVSRSAPTCTSRFVRRSKAPAARYLSATPSKAESTDDAVPDPREWKVPDPADEGKPSERIAKLAEEITSLNLVEVSELVEILKDKLNLGDAAMAMPAMGGGGGGAGGAGQQEAAAEKTEFDIKLEKFDAKSKIKVIKEVRAIAGLGLKEAKDLVEGVPAVVKKGVTKEEAAEIEKKLKEVGAEVKIE